jgi:hypothetical protein
MRIEELRRRAAKFLMIGFHTLAQWRCNRKGPEDVRTDRLVKSNSEALEAFLWSTTTVKHL